jgi:hypothetical protein
MIDIRLMNQAILLLAPIYEARDNAPSAEHDLFNTTGRSVRPVWAGASDRCIYGDARVNHAFRAWHDAAHIALGATFSLAGETAVCEAQIRALYHRFPSAPAWVARLLRAEIIDQAQHYAATGRFPENQAQFVSLQLG